MSIFGRIVLVVFGGSPALDLVARLDALAAAHKAQPQWRRSVIELLRTLSLDSSVTARRELARELNYMGDLSDVPALNRWLHRRILEKLAEMKEDP